MSTESPTPDIRDGAGLQVTQLTLKELLGIERPFSTKAGLIPNGGFTTFDNIFGLGVLYNWRKSNHFLFLMWDMQEQLRLVRNDALVPHDSTRITRGRYKSTMLTFTAATQMFIGENYKITIERFTSNGGLATAEVHSRNPITSDPTDLTSFFAVGQYMDDLRKSRVRPNPAS